MEIQKLNSQFLDELKLDQSMTHLLVSLESKTNHAKKIHDIKNAMRRLEILQSMIDEGFDFKASDATGIKGQLDEAIKIIKECVSEIVAIRDFSR